MLVGCVGVLRYCCALVSVHAAAAAWNSRRTKAERRGEVTGGACVCSARGLAAGQGNGMGELRILVVVVLGCVHVSGQHKTPHLPPPPCPASPSCSVFCCLGWHTFLSLVHLSSLLQAPQLTIHSPRLLSLPQLLQRPRIQLVSQLLGSFLGPANTPWLVHGILAAEKLSRLDCASIPVLVNPAARTAC